MKRVQRQYKAVKGKTPLTLRLRTPAGIPREKDCELEADGGLREVYELLNEKTDLQTTSIFPSRRNTSTVPP